MKDLDKDLPQKVKREKQKNSYSEMRSHLIDKCRSILNIDSKEKFEKYINEKNPKDKMNKIKILYIGNINLINELMKIKILSKKIGPDCIRNLYDRYQNNKSDKNMKELIK